MKRLLTAFVALPILLYTVWSSIPYFFAALAALAAVVALSEFYQLAAKAGLRPYNAIGYVASIAVVACFTWSKPEWAGLAVALLGILALAQALLRRSEMNASLGAASATVFGVVYLGVLPGLLVSVRMTGPPELGPRLLTMFFAMVMMSDTGAYYIGRALGRHKLAPRISPGKTVEGAIAGFVFAVASGPLSKLIFFTDVPLVDTLVLGAAIGVVGQVGDLAESLLKRGSDVKDSSRLLPGHGGMLDRMDSILFCAPLLYLYSRLYISRL